MEQFREILDQYIDYLYRAAYGMTGNKQDAEDLVQETFIKAYRNFSSLQSVDNVKSWLYRILMNTFINKYRKKLNAPKLTDVDVEEVFETYLADYRKSYERALREEPVQFTDEQFEDIFQQLHVELRTVLWLSDVEGFTQKEIAEMIDCPVGTVSSRLFRGRNLLKERLLNNDYNNFGSEEKGR